MGEKVEEAVRVIKELLFIIGVIMIPIPELLLTLFEIVPESWLMNLMRLLFLFNYRKILRLLSMGELKKFFPWERPRWDERRNFLIWYDRLLLLAWVFYVITLEKTYLRPLLSSIVNELPCTTTLKNFYTTHFLSYLVRLSAIKLLFIDVVVLVWRKKYKYKKLPLDEFPEYDFPGQESSFQTELVKFLNRDNQIGDNIHWIDGAWGTGKTYFIRTFFEQQIFKVREIYYVSCFGIKTRSDAEQVLQSEIEARFNLNGFAAIPVLGGLLSGVISWGFSISGLSLMKKDAIIIFDDLDRVAYNEPQNDNPKFKNDNPEEYNDLLGYIDYLANHKNQKVIVVYNSEDIPNTYKQIIEDKFRPRANLFPLTDNAFENILDDMEINDDFSRNVLKLIFKVARGNGYNNLRGFKRSLELLGGSLSSQDIIIWLGQYFKEVEHFCSFAESDNIGSSEEDFSLEVRLSSPYYWRIIGSNPSMDNHEFYGTGIPRKEEFTNLCELLDLLWEKSSNSVFEDLKYLTFDEEKSIYSIDKNNTPAFNDRIKLNFQQTLVSIYYDLEMDELKDSYNLKYAPANLEKDEFHHFKNKYTDKLRDYQIEQLGNQWVIKSNE